MTPTDDRRVPRTAGGTGPRSGDAAPQSTFLSPFYRCLILLNVVLSAAGLAVAVAAIPSGGAAARVGDLVRPSVAGCLAPATGPGRDAMPQVPARRPKPDGSPAAVYQAAAVLGCRAQLI